MTELLATLHISLSPPTQSNQQTMQPFFIGQIPAQSETPLQFRHR